MPRTPLRARAAADLLRRSVAVRVRPPGRAGFALALALAIGLARLASAESSPGDERAPDGPDEIRDEQLFAQPRLTLPPVSPHVNGTGRWTLRIATLCSSSFAWSQDVPGEQPAIRQWLVDGEAWTLDATLRRGLARDLDVGLRLALRRRGGGGLDGLIDAWHGLFHLPDDHRPEFERDAFRVEGVRQDGRPFSWSRHAGWGFGDLELETRWRLRDGAGSGTSLAVVGRLSLPTGSGPFRGNGLGGGGQLVMGVPFDSHAWLYVGLGGTLQGRGPVAGVEYAPGRVHAFLAIEWRPWRSLSFVAETDAASRLLRNVEGYPGVHWGLNVTGRLHLGEGRTSLSASPRT